MLICTNFPILSMSQDIQFVSNSRNVLGQSKDESASISAGDIDNDGDLDLIVANGSYDIVIINVDEPNKVFFKKNLGKEMVGKNLF